jgi:hypothetical protein
MCGDEFLQEGYLFGGDRLAAVAELIWHGQSMPEKNAERKCARAGVTTRVS